MLVILGGAEHSVNFLNEIFQGIGRLREWR